MEEVEERNLGLIEGMFFVLFDDAASKNFGKEDGEQNSDDVSVSSRCQRQREDTETPSNARSCRRTESEGWG